jgi:hypothetical protein
LSDVIKALGALVPDYTERRKHKRADLRFKVLLAKRPQGAADSGGVGAGAGGALYTENVSMGGLGLRWEQGADENASLALGDIVYLAIQVPRVKQVVRCRGRIAWIQAADGRYVRAGVTFDGISLEDLAGVEALMAPQDQP